MHVTSDRCCDGSGMVSIDGEGGADVLGLSTYVWCLPQKTLSLPVSGPLMHMIDLLLIGSARRVFRLIHPLWYRCIIYGEVEIRKIRIWGMLGIWWGTQIICRWYSVKSSIIRDDSHGVDKIVHNIDKCLILASNSDRMEAAPYSVIYRCDPLKLSV